MKAAESPLTFSRMRLSSHRENEIVLQLSGFRYLTESMIEDFLFGGSSFTPCRDRSSPEEFCAVSSAKACSSRPRAWSAWATNFHRSGSGSKFDMQVEGGWTTGRMVERYCKARPFEERRKAPSPFTTSRTAIAEKRPSDRGPSQQRSGLYGKRIA